MGLLRLANDDTTRIFLVDSNDEPTEDFIEVRKDISKRTFNRIALAMPNVDTKADGTPGNLTNTQALGLQQMLFDALVVGWSLDAPVSSENYLGLAREAGTAVDTAVAKHFESLTPSREQATKSEGPSASDAGGAAQPQSTG